MSDSVSKYYEDKADKEYWLEKARAFTNRSRYEKIKSFIFNLFRY